MEPLTDSRYRCVVVDPPWDHSDGTGINVHGGDRAVTHTPYPVMTVDAIAALPVREWSTPDTRPERLGSHLYLWATTRYVVAAHQIAERWGFTPSALLVWCKSSRGFSVGGTFQSNVEFCLFARRGNPQARTRIPTRWFQWPRGAHSAKPEAFYDMVEQVSPGPHLDVFSRRARLGWTTWGNESLHGGG